VSAEAPSAQNVVAGKIGVTLLCCYLLAVTFRIGGCYHPEERVRDDLPTAPPQVGERFPDFTLPDVSGVRISLADLAGRPALLVFVPSLDWSPPSKARVLDLAAAVAGRRDATLAVVLAKEAATPRTLAFIREHRTPAYYLIDGDGLAERLELASTGPDDVRAALPATFVLDASGVVLLRDVRRDPRTWLDAGAVLAAAGLSAPR
jgi:peroxiredoxin